MIGSMPQASAAEALDVLAQHPLQIPAWPQLPQRSFLEGMVPQYSEGFPGLKVDHDRKQLWVENDGELLDAMTTFYEAVVAEDLDSFAISPEYAAGLHAFLKQQNASKDKLPALKGQVTGPFTFGLGLCDQNRTAVWFDEQYRDIVLKGLGMKARWMIRELQKMAQKVLLFFDEPILSALGTPAYMAIDNQAVLDGLNEVIHTAQDTGARVGVHCCGNMDWGLLAQSDVDIIAFDAFFFGEKVALYPEPINRFLRRGGTLAYGLVPTMEPDLLAEVTPDSLRKKLETLQQHFITKGIEEDLVHTQILLTPSCGIGTLSTDHALRVLELLSDVRLTICV